MADLRRRSALGVDYSGAGLDYTSNVPEEELTPEVPMLSGDEIRAQGMGDFRRGAVQTDLSLQAGDLYAQSDDALAQGLDASAERLVAEAQALEQRAAAYQREVSSFQDVDDPLDAIDYLQGGLGSLLPTMGEPMAAGLAGAAAGSVFGPVGAFIGGAAAAAKPAFDMEASEQAASQHADETIMATTTPQERINERRIKAGTNALLEVAFPTILGGRLFGAGAKKLAKEAGSEVVEQGFRRTKTVAREGLLVEGNTELAQTISGQQSLNRLNPDRDTSEDWVEQIDSFILGAMGGTSISTATNVPGYLGEKIRDRSDGPDLEGPEARDGNRPPGSAGEGAFIPDSQTEELAGREAGPDDGGFIPDAEPNEDGRSQADNIDDAIARMNDPEFIAFTHFGDKQQGQDPGPQQSFTEEEKDTVYIAALDRINVVDEEIRTLEKFGLTPKTLKEKKKLRGDLENAGANLLRDMSPGAIEQHKEAAKQSSIINEAEAQDEKSKSLNLFITKGGVSEILKRGIKNVDAHLQTLINDDVITKEEAFAAEATPLGDAIIDSGGSQQDLENHTMDMIRDLNDRIKNSKSKQLTAGLESERDTLFEAFDEGGDVKTTLNEYFDIRGPANFSPKEKGMQSVSKNMTTGKTDTTKLNKEESIKVMRTDGKVHQVFKKDLKAAGARRFGFDKNNTLEALSADPSFVGIVDDKGKVIENPIALEKKVSDLQNKIAKGGVSTPGLKKQLTTARAQLKAANTAIFKALKLERPKNQKAIKKGKPEFESLGSETLDDRARTVRREIDTAKKDLTKSPKNLKLVKAYEKALNKLHTRQTERGDQTTQRGELSERAFLKDTNLTQNREEEVSSTDSVLQFIVEGLKEIRAVRRLEERVNAAKGARKTALHKELRTAEKKLARGPFDESTFESLRVPDKEIGKAGTTSTATKADKKPIKPLTMKQRAANKRKNQADVKARKKTKTPPGKKVVTKTAKKVASKKETELQEFNRLADELTELQQKQEKGTLTPAELKEFKKKDSRYTQLDRKSELERDIQSGIEKTPAARPTGVSVPMANMHKRSMTAIETMTPAQLTTAAAATAKAVRTTKFAPFKKLKQAELAAIQARQGIVKSDSTEHRFGPLFKKEVVTRDALEKMLNVVFGTNHKMIVERRPADGSIGTWGEYNQDDDTITLYADNVPNMKVAILTAWHETYHRGMRQAFNREIGTVIDFSYGNKNGPGHRYTLEAYKMLKEASTNPTVAAIIKEMETQRGIVGALAVEEALVEIGAAIDGNGWAFLEARYGIKVPPSMRGELVSLWRRFVNMLLAPIGLNSQTTSDAEVLQMLKKFKTGTTAAQKSVTADEMVIRIETRKYAEALTDASMNDSSFSVAAFKATEKIKKELKLKPKNKNSNVVAWEHFASSLAEKFAVARQTNKKPSFGLALPLEKKVLGVLEAAEKAEAEAAAAYQAAQKDLEKKTVIFLINTKNRSIEKMKQLAEKHGIDFSKEIAEEEAHLKTLMKEYNSKYKTKKLLSETKVTDLANRRKQRDEARAIEFMQGLSEALGTTEELKTSAFEEQFAEDLTDFRSDTLKQKKETIRDVVENIEMLKENAKELRELKQEKLAKEQELAVKAFEKHLDDLIAIVAGTNVQPIRSEGIVPTAAQISRTRQAKYKDMRLAQLNRELKSVREKLVRFKKNPAVSKALTDQVRALQIEIKKKDAARIAAKETLQFSNQSQGGHRRGAFKTVSQARKGNKALDAAAKKGERLVRKMLGDTLSGPIDWFLHKKEGGAFGSYSAGTQGKFIRAAIDSMDPLSTLFHESMHALAKELSSLTEGKVQYKKIAKLAMSPHIQMQLRNLLKNSPEAIAQLKDPNESVAYMFQFWATRESTGFRIQPAARNTFKRWAESFAQLIGYVTQTQAAEEIFTAFVAGDLATVPGIQDTLANVQHKRAALALQSIATPLGKGMSALFETPIDRLKRTKNKHLNILANKYFAQVKAGGKMGVIQMTAQQHGHWLNRFENTLQKHKATHKDMQRALRNLQAGKTTSALEREIRGLFTDMYKYASTGTGHITALVKDEDGRMTPKKLAFTPNFFPRVWNSKAIIEQETKLRKLLKQEGNLSDSEINNFIDAVRKGEGIVDLGATTSSLTPAFSAANPRTFDFITDENAHLFVEFQERDMHQIVSRYIRQVVHRREHGRAFGSDGKGVQKLLDAAERSGATPEQIDMARKAIEAMDGTLGTKNVSTLQRNTMVTAMTVVNFAVLPLALFSSLVDPLGVLVRTGSMKSAAATFRAGAEQVYNDAKKIKGSGQKLAEYLGIIEAETMLEVIGNTYNGMFMNQTLRKANSFFFKAIGLEQWTRGTRIGALTASLLYLRDNHANPKVLKELNLQPGDLNPEGIDVMSMPEGARRKRVEQALFRMVDEAILRPSSATRAIWMSDLRFVLFGHLKQFTFTFHTTINKQVAKNFKEQRADGKTIASAALVGWPLLTYVPVMIAADMLRAAVSGNWEDDDKDPFGKIVNNSIQRSGIMGLGNFIMDAQRDYKYGNLPINTVAGPTIGKSYDLIRTAVNDDASFMNALASLIPGAALWKGWFK